MNLTDPDDRPDFTDLWKPLFVGLSVAFGLFLCFLLVLNVWLSSLGGFKENVEKTGQFGDSFGVLTSLFTGLAFAALIVSLVLQRRELQASLRELRHSVAAQRQVAETSREELITLARQGQGATHERLYDDNAEWLRYLADNPELRPFFYDNRPLDGLDDDRRAKVLLAAELLAGLLELIVLQYAELPANVQPFWERFVRDIYRSSPALREYFKDYGRWYIDELRGHFEG